MHLIYTYSAECELVVVLSRAQEAHGKKKQNMVPRMAFLNEKFNTHTFCGGSKSGSA